MTDARQDFDTAVNLLADMLEAKLDGEVDFADDFAPWEYLRETMPPLADRLESEAAGGNADIDAIRKAFAERDPNNASRMRGFLDSL